MQSFKIMAAFLALSACALAQFTPPPSGGSSPNAVTAVSPGAGLAHFAGSTQAVTSSSVVNADIANTTIDLTAKVTGTLPAANLPTLTTGAKGIAQADGTSICVAAGVISGCTATGNISSANLLNLGTTAQTLVAAQGAGTVIQVDAIYLELVAASQYTFSGTLVLKYTSGAGTVVSGTCASAILTSAANEICAPLTVAIAPSISTVVTNTPVTIFASSAVTVGTGTLNYWVKYHVLSGF